MTISYSKADGQTEGTVFFVLDAGDLQQDTLRLPHTAREMAFVSALQRILQREGPTPWPVLVFSAPDCMPHAPDVSAVATTRRIIIRDDQAQFRPAAAILLNSAYWGAANPPSSWTDTGLAAVVARHELYHARRVWLRAQETNAHADAIEARMIRAGTPPPDRRRLELMVSQSIAAREEIEAIDRSLDSAVLLAAHRRGILQYREDNRLRDIKAVKNLMELFTSVKDPDAGKGLSRWLADLLHNDLAPDFRSRQPFVRSHDR